jgi:hypothetical protein
MSTYRNCTVEEDIEIGQTVYVFKWEDVGPSPRKRFGGRPTHKGTDCLTTPCLTNMGHKPILHGWMGTTNDISCYAMGVGVIVSFENTHDGIEVARVRMARKNSDTEESLLEKLRKS